MPKRAELSEERLRGLEAVFQGPKAIETEKQKTSKPEKRKVTLYLGLQSVDLLEELRLRLRREHRLAPSVASKSAIVEAALRLAQENLQALARTVAQTG
ncbi:MAG: hypothetical protein ACP5JD_07395 [Candidatus Bipolaricaulaceae bacterium]